MSADNVTFESFGLDPRLNQAITRLQFSKPTLVQATAIPLALEQRKDIIARARTGSGKTVAYAIPVIESILQEEQAGNRAIVLVPSKELADQVTKLFKSLTIYCGKTVGVVNAAAGDAGDAVLASLLAAKPAIVVGTPSRGLAHINSGAVDAKSISYLVIDEADLILSYGYEDDLKGLAEVLPVKKTAQAWIMTADPTWQFLSLMMKIPTPLYKTKITSCCSTTLSVVSWTSSCWHMLFSN